MKLLTVLTIILITQTFAHRKNCKKIARIYYKRCHPTMVPTNSPTTAPSEYENPFPPTMKPTITPCTGCNNVVEGVGTSPIYFSSADWPEPSSDCPPCKWKVGNNDKPLGSTMDLHGHCSNDLNVSEMKNICKHLCCYFNTLNSEPPGNVCNHWNLVQNTCYLYG